MEDTEGSHPEPQHGSWQAKLRSLIGSIGREREKPPAASLTDYLLKAAGNEPYALETQPKEFDLGKIGHEAEDLMRLTLKHPRKIEYGSIVYIDRKTGRLVKIRSEGDEHSVGSPDRVYFDRSKGRLSTELVSGDEVFVGNPASSIYDQDPDIKMAVVIHSHPHDIPFSPDDFRRLLETLPPKDVPPAIVVVTPNTKVLALRTVKSPLFLPGTLEPMNERIHKRYDPGQTEFSDFLNQPGGYQRMFWLTRFAQEFYLKIYSCPRGQNIVRAAN